MPADNSRCKWRRRRGSVVIESEDTARLSARVDKLIGATLVNSLIVGSPDRAPVKSRATRASSDQARSPFYGFTREYKRSRYQSAPSGSAI